MIKVDKNSDPRTAYRNALDMGVLEPDQKQFEIVGKLQDLHERLTRQTDETPPVQKKGGLFSRLFAAADAVPTQTAKPVSGLYLWGGVGRGKTLLCDLFFDGLPIEKKRRIHFHRFMQEVNDSLAEIKNEESPLEILSQNYANNMQVLVLDEMHVNDIADAMLMSGLLQGLFSRGVTLLTTSNFAPDDLYHDGLQRARFLPAIELLKSNTEVVFLGGDLDYRLRALQNADIYHTPIDDFAENGMRAYFQEAGAASEISKAETLTLNSRPLETILLGSGMVWSSFAQLCDRPRSTDDYIELARQFHTVLISDVPVMDGNSSDMARRFINMIDEFYDRNVKVVISAEAGPSALYTGDRLSFEFDRTVSRLVEMQSREYLAQPHKP